MNKKMRLGAALGAVLLAIALIFSVFFVAAEADHHCSGDHCLICQQIQACQTLLEQLSTTNTASVEVAAICFFALLLLQQTQKNIVASSPVLLRVKLLN